MGQFKEMLSGLLRILRKGLSRHGGGLGVYWSLCRRTMCVDLLSGEERWWLVELRV